MMSTTTENGNNLIKMAENLVEQAWLAPRLVDSHHWFLCAADLYQEAGREASARWATEKADQVMRAMTL